MRELALHILDIAENSVAAKAQNIVLCIDEDLQSDRLRISIQDDGKGMDEETARRVVDPFVTSRTTRKVGLGLPLLKAAAEACFGDLTIHSKVGRGTTVAVDFQHSHIDRMPLGDVASTMLGLIVAHPEVHWQLNYTGRHPKGQEVPAFHFDDQPVKEALGDVSLLCDPDVLAYLRSTLEEGIGSLRKQLIPALPGAWPIESAGKAPKLNK